MTWRDEITDDELDELRAWCPACRCSPCAGPDGKGSCLTADEKDDR